MRNWGKSKPAGQNGFSTVHSAHEHLLNSRRCFGWLGGIHETCETPSLPPGISHYSFEDIITEYQTNHFFALYLKRINLCSINNIDDLPSRLLSEKITSNCQLSSTYQNSIWKEEMFKEDSLWGMVSDFFFFFFGNRFFTSNDNSLGNSVGNREEWRYSVWRGQEAPETPQALFAT